MSSQKQTAQERRFRSQRLIKNLVASRTEMLSVYSELAIKLGDEESGTISDLLQKFCQGLIDYTANAHFQLYRYIDDNRERRYSVLQIAEKTYPKIVESTELILNFNDKYDLEDHSEDLSHLKEDLSRLGEKLAFRIDLEDRLIQALSRARG